MHMILSRPPDYNKLKFLFYNFIAIHYKCWYYENIADQYNKLHAQYINVRIPCVHYMGNGVSGRRRNRAYRRSSRYRRVRELFRSERLGEREVKKEKREARTFSFCQPASLRASIMRLQRRVSDKSDVFQLDIIDIFPAFRDGVIAEVATFFSNDRMR